MISLPETILLRIRKPKVFLGFAKLTYSNKYSNRGVRHLPYNAKFWRHNFFNVIRHIPAKIFHTALSLGQEYFGELQSIHQICQIFSHQLYSISASHCKALITITSMFLKVFTFSRNQNCTYKK